MLLLSCHSEEYLREGWNTSQVNYFFKKKNRNNTLVFLERHYHVFPLAIRYLLLQDFISIAVCPELMHKNNASINCQRIYKKKTKKEEKKKQNWFYFWSMLAQNYYFYRTELRNVRGEGEKKREREVKQTNNHHMTLLRSSRRITNL